MKSPTEFAQHCQKIIDTHGHMVQQVGVGRTGWAYTIGLAATLGYELICTGLPVNTAQQLLNDMATKLKKQAVPDDQPIAEIATMPLVLRTIDLNDAPDLHTLLLVSHLLEVVPTRVRQMMWPDPAGNFPGSEDYDFPVTQDLRAIAAQERTVGREQGRGSSTLH